jgi:hypothetical protein
MKQMTCAAAGGPATCDVMLKGETAVEMVENGMDHVGAAHPELAEDIGKMTSIEKMSWMADFRQKFDAAEEA